MSNNALPPRLPRALLLFTGLYMAAAVGASALQGNREFVLYLVVMGLLIATLAVVHRRVNLSPGLLWCLSAWGALHMAGGLVQVPRAWVDADVQAVLYSVWLIPGRFKFDQLVHGYGFAVATWLCWQVLAAVIERQLGRRPQPSFGLCLLCAVGGMGYGAANEVIEFLAVLTIPNTNVGGYINTGWDLVSNLVGSSLAATVIGVAGRRTASL
ncbi:MAG: DUF2238 domain-containing protein [Planctomycetota bacterium]